ncbi:DUF6287 domain-containing protein [Furfurilactobacillus curtus]|uniref:DUF6287 domain-containing protein n=1 Tax=Furfurilactobacillus curtus TaxID=1746200 RepID=A0ABQ5JNG3_9LACO
MKKIVIGMVGLLTLLTLSACGQGHQKASNPSQPTSSKKTMKKAATPKVTMDLAQIKAGNYKSLKGTWTEISTTDNERISGGKQSLTDTLTISNHVISNNGKPLLQGDILFDQDEQHQVIFKTNNNVLTGTLADQNVPINWSVTFYPVGTTSQYQADSKGKNTKNLIVVWTSNNSYTQVFAQAVNGKHSTKPTTKQSDSSSQAASSQQPTDKTAGQSAIDLSQIGANNFASLVGTWKNTAGQTIVVTDQVATKPAGSSATFDKGAVVSGQDHDGYPTVIASGSVSDGYMNGSMGSFDPNIKTSPFQPLAIVPKGVQLSAGDHSDSSKDRLIVGGIQSTSSDDVYYHQ